MSAHAILDNFVNEIRELCIDLGPAVSDEVLKEYDDKIVNRSDAEKAKLVTGLGTGLKMELPALREFIADIWKDQQVYRDDPEKIREKLYTVSDMLTELATQTKTFADDEEKLPIMIEHVLKIMGYITYFSQ